MTSAAASRAARGLPWLIIAGVLAAALSLRGPIVAPTPVLRQIEADLGIDAATAGLLTTAPVLMFALLTPVAALVIRRAGAELALLISLTGVLIGTFIRAVPGFGWMLAGMIVIGASITIGNVVIPVIIRREVPRHRVALVTAAYAALLNAGSLITSLFTAPLADVVGWPSALLIWAAITVAGSLVWGAHLVRSRGSRGGERFSGAEPGARGPDASEENADRSSGAAMSLALTGPLPVVSGGRAGRTLLRRPVAWLLMAAFGGQTLIYYALSTWLPTLTSDELGLDASAAGALASLYQGCGILGAFLVPLLVRFTPRIVPALVICASWIVLTVGLLVAPEMLWLWLSLGAIGHAGGFVIIFSALVAASRSDAEAAGMSALVQGGGYALGAVGAPLMGWLHEISGDWTLPLTVMFVLSIAYCAVLLTALAVAARSRR